MIRQKNSLIALMIITPIAVVSMTGLSLRALNAQTRPPFIPPERQKWEYCTVQMVTPGSGGWKAQLSNGSSIENVDSDISGISTVNRLGMSGWEVVSVVHERGGSVEYFLKRPMR
jgi:hypothetical protein